MYFLQFFQIYLVLPIFQVLFALFENLTNLGMSTFGENVKSTKICPLSMLVESQQFVATFDIDQERRRHSA